MILKARGKGGWIYIDNITFFEKVLDGRNSDGGHTTGEVTYMRNNDGVMTTIPLTTNDAYLLNDEGKTIESLCNLLPSGGKCEEPIPSKVLIKVEGNPIGNASMSEILKIVEEQDISKLVKANSKGEFTI